MSSTTRSKPQQIVEPVAEKEEDIAKNLANKDRETSVPSEGAVDDCNISEGQLISYDHIEKTRSER